MTLMKVKPSFKRVFFPPTSHICSLLKKTSYFLQTRSLGKVFLGIFSFFSHLSNLRHLVNYRYSYGMGWNHLWSSLHFTCITWVKEKKNKCTFGKNELFSWTFLIIQILLDWCAAWAVSTDIHHLYVLCNYFALCTCISMICTNFLMKR